MGSVNRFPVRLMQSQYAPGGDGMEVRTLKCVYLHGPGKLEDTNIETSLFSRASVGKRTPAST